MTEPNPQLVADLARLAAKYPPDDWEGLLSFLRDPQRQADLLDLVEQLASVSKRRRPGGGAGSAQRSGVREALTRIRTQDPDQADLLEDMWARLRRRELHPDMRAIKAFADAIGLKGLTATRRDQAVTEVMKHIIVLPAGDLATAMERASTADQSFGEEYERWVHLILDRPSSRRGDLAGGGAADQPDPPATEGGPKASA